MTSFGWVSRQVRDQSFDWSILYICLKTASKGAEKCGADIDTWGSGVMVMVLVLDDCTHPRRGIYIETTLASCPPYPQPVIPASSDVLFANTHCHFGSSGFTSCPHDYLSLILSKLDS